MGNCCRSDSLSHSWPSSGVDDNSGEHFLYYWDDRDGQAYQGWWVTPAVGSNNFEAVLRSAVPEGDAREEALLAGELLAAWSTELWRGPKPPGVTDRMRWKAARVMPLVMSTDGQGAHPCQCMRVTIVEGGPVIDYDVGAFRNFVWENGFHENMFSLEGLYVHEGDWNHGSRVYRWVNVDPEPLEGARDEPATWAEWFGLSANPDPEPARVVDGRTVVGRALPRSATPGAAATASSRPGDLATKHPDESYSEFFSRIGLGLTYWEVRGASETV